MCDCKEEIWKIYRRAGNLNVYVSVCNWKKERVLNDLKYIKDGADKLIAKLIK